MLHSTKALILKQVPYGDTSLIVTSFTESFGLQQYMVKGARSQGKKGQSLRPYLQPGALLEVVAYHHENRQLQYLRELNWARVYRRVLREVAPTAVVHFTIELLLCCLHQSGAQPDIWELTTQHLHLADEAEPAVVANLPLYFAIHLAGALGFMPENNFVLQNCEIFDARRGCFVPDLPGHGQALAGDAAVLMHQLLSVSHPVTLYRLRMSRHQRTILLQSLEHYFSWHVEGFGRLRSMQVLASLF